MKKILTLLFFLCTYVLSAQVLPHKFVLGGNMSYDSNKEEADLSFSKIEREGIYVNILPKIGYTLSKNITIGTAFSYAFEKRKEVKNNIRSSFYKQQIKALVPYIRYVGMIYHNKIGVLAEGSMKVGTGSLEQDNIVSDVKEISANLRPGIFFFVTPSIALEMIFGTIGYTSQKIGKGASTIQVDTFITSLDFNTFQFGVQYYLGQ